MKPPKTKEQREQDRSERLRAQHERAALLPGITLVSESMDVRLVMESGEESVLEVHCKDGQGYVMRDKFWGFDIDLCDTLSLASFIQALICRYNYQVRRINGVIQDIEPLELARSAETPPGRAEETRNEVPNPDEAKL